MNITLLAAEIARLVPEMALDSAVNNEALITGMLEREFPKRMDYAITREVPKFSFEHYLKQEEFNHSVSQ